ncbi:MAG: U3 snoRNP protein [Bathelium mastoideum]|nr:MAG: U3 snoRNP protein [Bathelium mastoideum]
MAALLEDVPAASTLLQVLAQSPHDFLQPGSSLHDSALALTKQYLDPVATTISKKQQYEHQEARRKRKRGEEGSGLNPLQLRQIHLVGFDVNQVYEQAKRVMSSTRYELEKAIPELEARSNSLGKRDLNNATRETKEKPISHGSKVVHFEDDIQEGGSDDSSLGQEGVDWEYDDDSIVDEEDAEDEEKLGGDDEVERANGVVHDMEMPLDDEDDIGVNGTDDFREDDNERDKNSDTYISDPNGLNDGFFSIDDFNKNSEFLERQDARGDPDDGAASDEEDVDWDTDPLAAGAAFSRRQDGTDDEVAEDEEDDDGPTFGDPMAASVEDEDEEMGLLNEEDLQGSGAMGNTNDIMYTDFFAPPARKASKKNRGRPNPHNFPQKDIENRQQRLEGQEDEMDRTISTVHHDLFDDALSDNESEEPLSDVDPSDPKSRRSTHERRQAKLASEIRRLEAANVAKREWTLAGEARAADRPLNSLLEEDLEFERAGKPVPVITQEVTEDIEALIKRRILAREFDEVIRRRPDDLVTGSSAARRGKLDFELDDTKATQGLAEEYEQEHLRRTDPNFVDVRDEKLKKEHREIEAMWKDVSARLDALSNWHYKPKPVASNLEIRVDAPTITLEDARPAAGDDVGGASMLAPQEVYAAGETRVGDGVVTKGGMPVGKEEMSRDEKTRRRRRQKERLRKAGGQDTGKQSEKSKEKKAVIGDLKRGGVKVIGRKGDVVDVEGKKIKGQQTKSGGAYKL